MNDDLVNKVESLKIILVSRATGGPGDDIEYKNLRREFTTSSRIGKMLPRFVHVCRDLSQFWSLIKPKSGTYADRREYLRNEFDPLDDAGDGIPPAERRGDYSNGAGRQFELHSRGLAEGAGAQGHRRGRRDYSDSHTS